MDMVQQTALVKQVENKRRATPTQANAKNKCAKKKLK